MMAKASILSAVAVAILSMSPVSAAPTIIALPTLDSVRVKVIDASACQPGTDLSFDIRHWPDNASLAQGQIQASRITNDNLGYPSFLIQGLQPKPWTLQDPELYSISIRNTAGQLVGRTRFGFRTFEVRDRKFYLNGRPIFLRCNAINPPGRGLPEATGKDPRFIKYYLKLLKSAGVNMIRTNTDDWLNACDEMGLMVFQGRYGAAPGGTAEVPPPISAAKIAYRDIILALANHPSVTIYVLTNEVNRAKYKSFLEAIRQDIKLLDPTRPVIGNAGFGKGEGGEVYDDHRYLGWYYGSAHDWYELNAILKLADAAGQPLTVSECVAAYTTDSGVFQTVSKQMATSLHWSGPEVDQKAAALDYQAELTRYTVEIARRLRTSRTGVAGIMPFTYFFGWAKAVRPDDLIIKPAFDALKTVFQPVLISPECWKRSIYAGDNLQMRLFVVNDDDSGRDISPSQAVVEILRPDGSALASGQTGFGIVLYYSNAHTDLAIQVPANTPKGDYTVRCRLIENGKEISRNSFQVTVAPRDWTTVTDAQVTLYDPANTTAASLHQLGIRYTKISTPTFPQSGVVVIGEGALGAARPAKADVLAFLNRGGRILCLCQSPEDWSSDWLPADFSMSAGYCQTCIHPVGGNREIFRDLRPRDFRFWNEVSRSSVGTPMVCPVLGLLWPASHNDLASCRVWASSELLMSGAALLELFHGSGSVIVSQFRCTERTDTDPIAAKLLANLVTYALSPSHPGLVDLSRPIKWDLEAFRTGVFCSKVQGFLPHSPVYRHTGGSKGLQGADQSIDGFTLVGSYDFNRFGWIRPVPDPTVEGWGVFYGRLSKPATGFALTLRNPSRSAARIKLRLDGVDVGSPAVVSSGEQETVEWSINRSPGPVQVELRGDQHLVITESRFQ